MTGDTQTMAKELAKVASDFQRKLTGHAPRAVTVVLSEETLVITLHDALTPAERAAASSPDGAAQVQQFHSALFASASETLRQEIKRITGVNVRDAAASIEPASGSVVQAFTSGTMVQVFLMAEAISEEKWNEERKTK